MSDQRIHRLKQLVDPLRVAPGSKVVLARDFDPGRSGGCRDRRSVGAGALRPFEGDGVRFEMYVYVADLDRAVRQLSGAGVPVLREPEDMPWGERIATVADPEGNPVALCQQP